MILTVAAYDLRARGIVGAAGARADRRGSLDRAALKESADARCISCVEMSLALHIFCMPSAVASAVGEVWAGRAGEGSGRGASAGEAAPLWPWAPSISRICSSATSWMPIVGSAAALVIS